MQMIYQNKFVAIALTLDKEVFVIRVIYLGSKILLTHFEKLK